MNVLYSLFCLFVNQTPHTETLRIKTFPYILTYSTYIYSPYPILLSIAPLHFDNHAQTSFFLFFLFSVVYHLYSLHTQLEKEAPLQERPEVDFFFFAKADADVDLAPIATRATAANLERVIGSTATA